MNNQTPTPFLTLGTPEKVVINGEQITHPEAIKAYLTAIKENPAYIRAIAFSIINGIVKVYVKTTDDAKLNLHDCETCKYCQIRYVARIMDNTFKCRLMKYKTIDIVVLGGGSPAWCPLKKNNGGE